MQFDVVEKRKIGMTPEKRVGLYLDGDDVQGPSVYADTGEAFTHQLLWFADGELVICSEELVAAGITIRYADPQVKT